jgi:hypothetical protein
VSESVSWVVDDPSILANDILYRRVEKDGDPRCFTTDRISGTKCLGPAAFTISSGDKGFDGGLSVHVEGLLAKHRIPTRKLVNWETHGVARFEVAVVRSGNGGVVLREDPEDPHLGKAHALMRTQTADLGARAAKREWSVIRSQILDNAVYFENDPGFLRAELADVSRGTTTCDVRTALYWIRYVVQIFVRHL